ncbi:MAG: agmatinase [Rhodospirillales bacterium]|nr:agmatinase [Rhodospirillales bacterium]
MSDDDNDQGIPEARKLAWGAVYKPRYAGVATFMRQDLREDPEHWDGIEVGLIGVPFDGGVTNRPGARHGPRKLRDMSSLMGRINHHTRVRPYDWAVSADLGDVLIEGVYDLDRAIDDIEQFYAKVAAAGIMPLTGGGDHAITLPIMRALSRHMGEPLGMVHFDAHCDTGPELFGHKHHHGGPFRCAVEDGVLDPGRTIQIGIRGPAEVLWDFSYESGMTVIHIEELYEMGIEATIAKAREIVGDGPTYVSFDVDGMDPVYAPGTGTPEVGGFTTFEAQQMVRGLMGINIVGGDLVEVSPPFDTADVTALNGIQMMWEILCLMADRIGREKGRIEG